ncbi:MAG TPA: peptidase U32 [Eubacterium sp.]|nr:peptidase U32 [Eubacterium sp.]HAZ86395.1 peptidase U32 [Eubacterium sp.]
MIDMGNREVLAPAGTYECFRAAINAGADAVYLGGSMFGARAFAGNFEEAELIKAIRTAHLYGRKVYLTVNTLLRNDELEKLVQYVKPYYEEGLDAVIVQDYGVFAVLREAFPGLDLHASTQMTITGKYGAQLLKDMGAARVVPARELSAKEIRDIYDNVDVEIESFVHGALCYCYSGQCLLSSMIGGRSGNRGRCAQPCRLTYSANGISEKYLLSPKDMCTIEAVPDILDAGVYSLKIEGRMKSPEYVAGVSYAYRKYVDMYLEKGRDGYRVEEQDIRQLMDLYNRGGFCKGYYYAQNDKSMMTFDRPNHQGIVIGNIKNGELILSQEVNPGDVLEFPDGSEYTTPTGKKSGRLALPKGVLKNPKNGAAVYRTRNNELLGQLRAGYIDNDIKIPVRMEIFLKSGERACLKLLSGDKELVVYGDVLEPSDKRPAVREDVVKQLKKLGGTAFSSDEGSIVTDIQGSPFVPVRLLNDLRRNALEELESMLLSGYKRNHEYMKVQASMTAGVLEADAAQENAGVQEIADAQENAGIQENTAAQCNAACEAVLAERRHYSEGQHDITVQVMNKEQLEAVLRTAHNNVSRIYISTELLGIDGAIMMKGMVDEYNAGISANNRKIEVYMAMPYIFRDRAVTLFERKLEDVKAAGFDGMLIRSPEELGYIRKKGLYELYAGRVVADYNVYTYNKAAFDEYIRLGIHDFTLSEELNAGQLRGLCRSVQDRNIYLEKLVYGYLPLMVTAGCTLKYTSKDKPCGRPGVYYLTDRKGKQLAALNSCSYCYNLIYNSVPEYLLDKPDEIRNMGVDALRLSFSIEGADEVENIMKMNADSVKAYTRGHYNRGVD